MLTLNKNNVKISYRKLRKVNTSMAIKVEVEYCNVHTGRNKQNDLFIYPLFRVSGHANDGTINSIKCCAGVTAILSGLQRLVVGGDKDTCVLKRGYFEYRLINKHIDIIKDNIDTQYALNVALCQLFNVSKMYPSLFEKFEMKEVELCQTQMQQ